MDDAAHYMEMASFVLIIAFGLSLLWRKVPLLLRPRVAHLMPEKHGSVPTDHHHDHHHCTIMIITAIPMPPIATIIIAMNMATTIIMREGEVCATCGHSHAPDPAMLAGEFNWKTAWAAIIAVGLRPCSGALIVLTFSLLNGLVLGGILSVFAMALGTFITVAILATLAVTAKNVALKVSGASALSGRVQNIIEVSGALFIVLFGALLLTASIRF